MAKIRLTLISKNESAYTLGQVQLQFGLPARPPQGWDDDDEERSEGSKLAAVLTAPETEDSLAR